MTGFHIFNQAFQKKLKSGDKNFITLLKLAYLKFKLRYAVLDNELKGDKFNLKLFEGNKLNIWNYFDIVKFCEVNASFIE